MLSVMPKSPHDRTCTLSLNPLEGQGFTTLVWCYDSRTRWCNTISLVEATTYSATWAPANAGGEQSIVPFVESGADVEDFVQRYYGNRGLVDTILSDVRFTQPYGQDCLMAVMVIGLCPMVNLHTRLLYPIEFEAQWSWCQPRCERSQSV